MSRTRTAFVCRECGASQPRWMGKCPDCGAWDALDPFRTDEPEEGAAPAATGGGAQPLAEVKPLEAPRIPTGLGELDRCLGGGFVPGSAVMIGGDPGIGKSTLMLQALSGLAAAGTCVLYATSEESAQQVKLRAERILAEDSGRASQAENLFLLAESSLARVLEQARRVKPAVLVLDSIQMTYRHDVEAGPGSAAQLRRCCIDLVQHAKTSGCVVVLVGHVTKEGDLAGPKILEHLVDVVLSFEGDRHHQHRLVRAAKNRFGTTQEIGLFEMTGSGLVEGEEGAFVEAGGAPRPGLAVFPTLAGSRCLLAEVQALTATGFLGSAKRRASGLDPNRLAMLVAVLEKHGGLRLADQDIYAAAAGGMRVLEPASDLAVCAAIAGAHLSRVLPAGLALIGEVGLSGEVRTVRSLEQRCAESLRRGCTTVGVPAKQAQSLGRLGGQVVPIESVQRALGLLS